MSIAGMIRQRGGVVSAHALRTAGVGRRQIEAALRNHEIVRIRTGWYRSREAPEAVVRAVAAGGVLTCVSALDLQGVWTMPDPSVHVSAGRGTGIPTPGVRIHWSDRRHDDRFPMDAALDAIEVVIRCLDQRAAIVALDSALHLGLVSMDDVEARTGARGRRLLRLVDRASESGTETLARLALRRLRLRVRSQVQIAGVGRVDLVIGDRLVLELDSRRWHDGPGDFERDRRRDRELAARGYITMRATYAQVMTEWPQIEEQILRLVRRNAHRWPRTRAPIPRG